jgi:hypothetical protein
MWVVNLVDKCNIRINLANNINEITHLIDALKEVSLYHYHIFRTAIELNQL